MVAGWRFAPVLAYARSVHADDPQRLALVAAIILGAAVVVAVVGAVVWALVRRSSTSRAPCPGCGTFLAPGTTCPACGTVVPAPGPPRTTSPPAGGRPGRGRLALEAFILVGALVILALARGAAPVRAMSVVFVSIVLEAFPFMLLGALVGGLVEVFVPREKLAAVLPSGGLATVAVAAALGCVFPVCECAVVPVVRRLLRKGVPFSAAVAYLLAGPIVNPVVAASTAVAYKLEWKMVIARLVSGYAIAIAVGLAMGRLFTKASATVADASDDEAHADGCDCHADVRASRGRFVLALDHAASDFVDIGVFLVMGAFVAAVLQTAAARSAFVALAASPAAAILMMMVLAVALNLCSEADAFVATSFRVLPASAQMAFMVLGPMLDVKLVLMYLRVFRKRAIVALTSMVLAAVFAAMLIFHAVDQMGR